MTLVHQLASSEAKSCVYKKQIIKAFLPSNICFWLKESSIYKIAFSSEKVVSTEPSEKYAQII